MHSHVFRSTAAALVLAAGGLYSVSSHAAQKTDCQMRFNLAGWSAIYKHAEGNGTITCQNGMTMQVNIVAVGGGLTVGKSRIDNGVGRFSEVSDLSELLGDYAQGEAHAGIVKSSTAQVLTKGTVSLALSGTGEGVDLGISFGKFTISRAR